MMVGNTGPLAGAVEILPTGFLFSVPSRAQDVRFMPSFLSPEPCSMPPSILAPYARGRAAASQRLPSPGICTMVFIFPWHAADPLTWSPSSSTGRIPYSTWHLRQSQTKVTVGHNIVSNC